MKTSVSNPSPILDDWPSEKDQLGFEPYRDTLVDILCNSSTHTPLTIGLFGTWGSGKTSLMRMIQADIKNKDLPDFHTTWFNAWKYHYDKVLWRALILRVLDALRPFGPEETLTQTEKDLSKNLDRLEESLYRTVEWEEIGRWTLDWFKALHGTAQGAAEIALAFVPGGTPMINLLKQAATAITGTEEQAIAEAFRRELKTHRREQLRSLEQFEREFHMLLSRYVVKNNGRLIIFVDDLDRCLPEDTIEVLEAIKLFLDVPGCIFILGLDQQAIIEAIQTRYEGEMKGRQYLEKLIQLPFILPPIETEGMQNYVDGLVPHLPDHRCSRVFAEGLPHNPRQVKRTINIFLLLWRLSRKKLPDVIQPVRLTKIVTIQQSHPEFYALLCEVPGFLRDLEAYFRANTQEETDPDLSAPNLEQVKEETEFLSLSPQLQSFAGKIGLRRLLTLYPPNEPDVNFVELKPNEIRPYIFLTRQIDAQTGILGGVPEPQMITIPAGEVQIGSDDYDLEKPVHTVYLPEYVIGRYPVTNYEYSAYVKDTGIRPPQHWDQGKYPDEMGDHPVTFVSWKDATNYCKWLGQKTLKKYRLPSEAEWEKAARGTQGFIWPWGNDWDAAKCNSAESGIRNTTPVAQFSPDGDSPFGLVDMAGNVWEWCNSLEKSYPYKPDDGREILEAKGERILRGGGFSNKRIFVRCAYRINRLPNSRDRVVGFRVAATVS
jgi:formylglycine-generating enzyme required for sulfatase activity